MTPETWKPVVGYEGLYEVSDQGRVRSVDKRVWYSGSNGCPNGVWKNRPGRVLKPAPGRGYGYLLVCLFDSDRQRKTRTVHSLVAEAFLGPRPDGQCVLHGPKGKLCNALTNLSYGTYSQNGLDKVRDGTDSRGSKNSKWTGLTDEAVLEIFNEPVYRGCRQKLMDKFKVSLAAVKSIRSGKSWSWLTGKE